MNPLAALLRRLEAEGLRLELRGDGIAVTPKHRLTPAVQAEILQHRADVVELLRLHGHGLLDLFRDAPTWPPSRGRSGPVDRDLWQAVGKPIRLRDGREGQLRAISYDTRSGRVRLRVDFPNGWALVDPEDATAAPETDRRTA